MDLVFRVPSRNLQESWTLAWTGIPPAILYIPGTVPLVLLRETNLSLVLFMGLFCFAWLATPGSLLLTFSIPLLIQFFLSVFFSHLLPLWPYPLRVGPRRYWPWLSRSELRQDLPNNQWPGPNLAPLSSSWARFNHRTLLKCSGPLGYWIIEWHPYPLC